MMRLAFVLPRYGVEILGGAETTARELSEQLVIHGHEVAVLTTCARDYTTWQNVDPPGIEYINGVRVERFPIAPGWRTRKALDLGGRLPSATVDEQYEWVHHLPHPPELYQKLIVDGASYDLVFFIPYVCATSYYGSALVNDRSVIWPCLHNELYASLHPTRAMLAAARGVMYNSHAEQALARQLGVNNPREAVVGVGINERVGVGQRFTAAFGLSGPYLIYAGRLDEAKNVQTLVDYFVRYKEARGGEVTLVLAGSGALRDAVTRSDIRYTGRLEGQMLLDAIAGAVVLCQPSLMESFSIVIMQAWMAGVPVLIHAGCAVTLEHVQDSGGGLSFSHSAQFMQAMDTLLLNTELRRQLGAQGGQYARMNYSWDAVIGRFEQALKMWRTGQLARHD